MRQTESEIPNEANEESGSESRSIWKSLLTLVELTNHALIFLVTGYVLYLAGKQLSVTNAHAGLLTVGYVLLMSEAIAALSGESILTRNFSRRIISHVHWVLQCLGGAFSIAGFVIMYQVKEIHFKSIHAILGISSLVIMLVLTIFGVPVMYATSLRKVMRPVTTKMCHNFLGISCFVLGMASQCYAYQKKWMTSVGGNNISTLATVFTALIIIFSLLGPLRSLRRQLGAAFSDLSEKIE
ncbi:uncharacterized protein [Venturia canescens]|uniref:uncharacterized protein isoform X2 n=1 Tax=Venturia canescens TaxID=32260 RepID=UPI001C9CABDD|nr:uncharacterized protein LOC122416176 isoform X2 [Venturia canescens]